MVVQQQKDHQEDGFKEARNTMKEKTAKANMAVLKAKETSVYLYDITLRVNVCVC